MKFVFPKFNNTNQLTDNVTTSLTISLLIIASCLLIRQVLEHIYIRVSGT